MVITSALNAEDRVIILAGEPYFRIARYILFLHVNLPCFHSDVNI